MKTVIQSKDAPAALVEIDAILYAG